MDDLLGAGNPNAGTGPPDTDSEQTNVWLSKRLHLPEPTTPADDGLLPWPSFRENQSGSLFASLLDQLEREHTREVDVVRVGLESEIQALRNEVDRHQCRAVTMAWGGVSPIQTRANANVVVSAIGPEGVLDGKGIILPDRRNPGTSGSHTKCGAAEIEDKGAERFPTMVKLPSGSSCEAWRIPHETLSQDRLPSRERLSWPADVCMDSVNSKALLDDQAMYAKEHRVDNGIEDKPCSIDVDDASDVSKDSSDRDACGFGGHVRIARSHHTDISPVSSDPELLASRIETDMTCESRRQTGCIRDGGGSAVSASQSEILYEPLPVWVQFSTEKQLGRMSIRASGMHTKSSTHTSEANGADEIAVNMSSSCLARKLMMSPNSNGRTLWDIGTIYLVLYDIIVVPLRFMLPEDYESNFMYIMEWFSRVFWSADMPMSCLSGNVSLDGTIELRPTVVVQRYFRSWLALDCVVVGSDWIEILVLSRPSDSTSVLKVGRMLKIFRIVRMLRLLRAAKVNESFNLVIERLPSQKLIMVVQVFKLMVIVLACSHVIACFWCAMALNPACPNSQTWITNYGYDDRTFKFRYVMSYRWALSQFSGGMDEVTPISYPEHVYTGCIYVLTYWAGNVIASILTSHMTQIFVFDNQNGAQLNHLKLYLRQNSVSKGIAMRVIRNAQHTLERRAQSTPEEAVGLKDLVSTPLQIELHFEMYSSILAYHPWFGKYSIECPTVVRRVCHSAMSASTNAEGDCLFHCGEEATAMLFCKTGRLRYSWGPVYEMRSRILRTGNWIAEAALWLNWLHRGELVAVEDSMVVNLHAVGFQEIVNKFAIYKAAPSLYAFQFAHSLNCSEVDVSDLPLDSAGGGYEGDPD